LNLKAIQELIEHFKQRLRNQKLSDLDWLYEKQFQLQDYPILNADNIQPYLEILFTSDRTQRYWKSETLRSAELMTSMVKFDAEMVGTAFRDLFDEARDLEGRMDRFKFYLDEIIARMRKKDKSFLESWHHQDNAIISYYLIMAYPCTYSYYTRPIHEHAVTYLGAKALQSSEDPVRYQKMVKILATIASNDEALKVLHASRFQKPIAPGSRLLIYEMLQCLPI
jgi:hypothetical protein